MRRTESRIRPAALAELSLLPAIEIAADALLDEAGIDTSRLPAPGTETDLSAALHIMVAGRPPVGFVRIEEVDGAAHLAQLSVEPGYARQGVGRALVAAAKAWAVESGYTTMSLTTFADVPFNGPFCATCGFRILPVPGPGLAALLQAEETNGLGVLGKRVAMEVDLVRGIN